MLSNDPLNYQIFYLQSDIYQQALVSQTTMQHQECYRTVFQSYYPQYHK